MENLSSFPDGGGDFSLPTPNNHPKWPESSINWRRVRYQMLEVWQPPEPVAVPLENPEPLDTRIRAYLNFRYEKSPDVDVANMDLVSRLALYAAETGYQATDAELLRYFDTEEEISNAGTSPGQAEFHQAS